MNNTLRFLSVMGIIVVASVMIGVVWMSLNAPQVTVTCTPALELRLVERFKADVAVFGVIGAVVAALLYYWMLRYQVFFPGRDVKRFAIATGAGVVYAVLLTVIDSHSGSQCLQKALGPDSAVGAEIPSIGLTLFGHVAHYVAFNVNVWLVIFLDQLLCILVFIAVAKLLRWVSLRRGHI